MVHQKSHNKIASIPNPLGNTDVIILCGGEGKRLRSVVSNRPKVLAEVASRVFLDILVDRLLSYGFRRIILSVGYMKEEVFKHFDNHPNSKNILFAEEEIPLGTGGALKNAAQLVKSDDFLVMNGDSFCGADLSKLYLFHKEKKGVLSIAVAVAQEPSDYGVVSSNILGQVLSFNEKASVSHGGFVNAGIYFMAKKILGIMPPQKVFSLEYDFFPEILNHKCFAFDSEAELIDIGTPERYKLAQKFFSSQPVKR